jgi:predicted nuclease with TOPRIM domain
MIATMDPTDPIRKILQLKQLMLMDGVDFDDVRDYVKQQLLAMGIRKPETPEEEMFVQQIQSQPKEPDAATLLSMAEMKKAEAIEGKNQVAAMDVQLKAQNEGMKRMIDEFKAMTDRMNMQIDAQEASANISNKDMDTASKQLDNASKMIEIQTPDLSQESDENLFAMVAAG